MGVLRFVIAGMIALLIFGALFAIAIFGAESIALAVDGNFEAVFPQNDYFQSANPTLVGANAQYLIVYDEASSQIYSRSNNAFGTFVYDVDFEKVDNIFAIGNVAFIYADGKYFTIDLTDENASPIERNLDSPMDISYFNSDGNYLYAKSTAGYITVYDQNLQVAFECDNRYNDDLLAGKPVIAGEGDNLFVFTIVYGNPFFVKYNLSNDTQSRGVALTKYVQEAYVGDIIYALETVSQSNDKHIIGIDKDTGNILFTSNVVPDKFFAFGSRLFSIEGRTIVIYTLAEDKLSLEKTSTISMAGADEYHFDAPLDVVDTENGFAVADSNNNRVALVDVSNQMSCVYLDFSPKRICANANDVYVADNNNLVKISNGEVQNSVQIENIADIAFLDKLYVLTTDGVYTCIGDRAIKLCDISDGKRITAAKDGTNVYVLTEDTIAVINQNGQRLPNSVQGDFTEAIDFAVDYAGKITVAYQNGYKQFYNGTLAFEATLRSSTLKASITSVCLKGHELFFTAKECFIGKTAIDATTAEDFSQSAFSPNGNESFVFAVRTNENAVYIPGDGRIEGTSLSTDDVLIIFEEVETAFGENFAFAMYKNTIVIIDKNDFETVETTPLSGEYAISRDTKLYTLPYCEQGSVPVGIGERVRLVSDVAGFDGNSWSVVKFGENEYFVRNGDIEPYTEIIPEKDRIFGKANANRVGGLVNVYAEQSDGAEVLFQIVDGTKVEVLETLEDFYYISHDGRTGYVAKEQLAIDKLTTVQIVAIVLCIIVLVAGSAIFASIHVTRKNEESKKQENSLRK